MRFALSSEAADVLNPSEDVVMLTIGADASVGVAVQMRSDVDVGAADSNSAGLHSVRFLQERSVERVAETDSN